MEFIVICSSSKGNCYLLKNEKECLILECGISFKEVKKMLDFDLSNVVGCLVTHEHSDDCKYIKQVVDSGIYVYMSAGTGQAINIKSHRINIVEAFNTFVIGGFTIMPFDVKHDAYEPFGYVIHHKDTGSILFVSDTVYVEYSFKNIAHILVECNYSINILNEKVVDEKLKNRIIRSHFEINNVMEFVKANLNPKLKNVVLLHLSEDNSNHKEFKKAMEGVTSARVEVAERGVQIEIGEK